MPSLNYIPSPTGERFINDRSFIKLIWGPVGAGKSTVALFDLLQRSINQAPFHGVRKTKHILTRNTMPQLKSTVKPLIDTWFIQQADGMFGKWRLSDSTFEMRFALPDGTEVHSDFVMLPADTPDDIGRLLSLEASSAWVEECREYDPDVFETLTTRVLRYPSVKMGGITYPGVIGSTNAPPLMSWWQKKIGAPPSNWRVFAQPPALLDDGSLNPDAENLRFLAATYYSNAVEGKSKDWIDVYLRNKFGSGGFGEPVYSATFRADFHVAKSALSPIYSTLSPLVVGMDNGLTAAAVICQQDMRGRVNVLGECFVPEKETMGVETFMDRVLIPYLTARFRAPPSAFLFVLDPACWQRSQANEVTIADVVERRGYRTMRAPTNKPEARIQAVEGLLNRAIDGGPGLLISPECPHLIAAFTWGYRNKKTASGVMTATPEKNHFSHVSDGMQYAALHFNGATPGGGGWTPWTAQAPVTIERAAYRWV